MTIAKPPMLLVWATLSLAVLLSLRAESRSANYETAPQDRPNLAPGQPIEREWDGAQPQLYRLRLEAGQYVNLRIDVSAGTFSFKAALLAPDGGRIEGTRMSNLAPEYHYAALVAIAPLTGEYAVEIRENVQNRAAPPDEKPRYKITLTALGWPDEQDKARVEAWRCYAEGIHAHYLNTSESLLRARELLHQAYPLFHQAGDAKQESDALFMLADVYSSLGDYERAIEFGRQSVEIVKVIGDARAVANALMYVGEACIHLDDFARAIATFQEALPLWRSAGKTASWGVGWTLHSLASCYFPLGERQKAAALDEEVFRVYQAIDYNPHEKHRGSAAAATNLGKIYLALGEIQKAIEWLDLGLEHWQAIGEKWGEARVYYFRGNVYLTLGEMAAARENYEQALRLWRISNDPNNIGNVLHSLGDLALATGDHAAAESYLTEALELRAKHKARRGQAESLALLGKLKSLAAEPAKAIALYEQSLAIWRELGARSGEAAALGDLGEAYYRLGDKRRARELLRQALLLHRVVQAPDGEAQTLYWLARAERDLGSPAEARRAIEAAVGVIESIRASVVSLDFRASYLARVRNCYELYVDLLMQGRREEDRRAALHVNERASARSLLETLRESRPDIRQGADADLTAREHELQQLLNGKSEYQARLLGGKHRPEQAAATADEIKTIVNQLREVRARIRARNPRYAALTQPAPLDAERIQRELLPNLLNDETLLLEYALGEERSYVWAVTLDSLTSHELPRRAEIEALAARVYELLTARNRRPADESPRQEQARIARADAELAPLAAALSRMILGPVAAELGRKRLLIVAQGKLQFIPFGVLPEPEASQSAIPLVVNHEIVHLPSASTLAVLRQETAGRQLAPKTIALLADPVFEPTDGRLKSRRTTAVSPEAAHSATRRDLLRAAKAFDETGETLRFRRLESTGWEAERIARLAPAAGVLKATGFAANRAIATGGALGDYRIIHFATHGFLHSAHPELSGLVLSLLDERGREQDGFLRLHEIYNLKLPAELVVLSACQSGLGREVKGEGLMSLTRGFMYAGAPRVVVSAWSIEDRASATLMVKFYKHLFAARAPSPAAALRAAQLELWRTREFAAPYFWGGFALQGEWRWSTGNQ